MTVTEAQAIPVPDSVLLTRRIRLARILADRADADAAQAMSDAATARHHLAQLEAQVAA
jgi:hypothetical protein